jgi:hypothetical protein
LGLGGGEDGEKGEECGDDKKEIPGPAKPGRSLQLVIGLLCPHLVSDTSARGTVASCKDIAGVVAGSCESPLSQNVYAQNEKIEFECAQLGH